MANIIHERHHQGDEPHLLREVMGIHHILLNEFSRQVGMPSSRLALMRLLSVGRSENLGIMEIARRLGVNAAAVTRQIKAMEAEGLVARVADARDGRRCYVGLTPEGLQVFERLHKRAHAFERELGSFVNSEDIATTVRVLTQIRGALESLR